MFSVFLSICSVFYHADCILARLFFNFFLAAFSAPRGFLVGAVGISQATVPQLDMSLNSQGHRHISLLCCGKAASISPLIKQIPSR
jgi:hypothetical protein